VKIKGGLGAQEWWNKDGWVGIRPTLGRAPRPPQMNIELGYAKYEIILLPEFRCAMIRPQIQINGMKIL